MKKILLMLFLLVICSPIFAMCYIQDGMCGLIGENKTNAYLKQKYMPETVNQMRTETSTIQNYKQPSGAVEIQSAPILQSKEYNANCQFGTCLGGDNPLTPNVED